jgi:predicted ArsR family transcriptional regulator
MKSRIVRKIAQSQKYRILCALKQKGPLSVPDLLKLIRLSYMGVKQHCIELERDGYLTKRRKPKTTGRGRPEQLYELTAASEEFFPKHDTPLLREILTASSKLFGAEAAQKIFDSVYSVLITQYKEKLTSSNIEERIRQFVEVRERDGYLLQVNPPERDSGWQLVEYHSPIVDLVREHGFLKDKEAELYRECLHSSARQSELDLTHYRAVYELPK